ncbi:MAG TPA: RagB/SusD family nutrient uptake outer membrane protein [Chryseosolibacter sp.]|nr:RagB/SusD family nutrient uptake outer membrane protein [Chryseosolibacter sp.]
MASSCNELLEPEPIDLLTDDIVLNEPKDVPTVEIGLYEAFRVIAPASVIAGDFMADNLIHNGTFTQYRELGTKRITSANASAATLWSAVYNTVYLANFIIERLPGVPGVASAERERVLATARFLRGYAYFIGVYSFGDMPKVVTTSIEDNKDIPRTAKSEILAMVLEDYLYAIGKLPEDPANAGFASEFAVRAALARYYLYLENWAEAAAFATEVIDSELYSLEPEFETVVQTDFTDEAIFEMGYNLSDDPGTNSSIGLNNLFVGRREIIPSNQAVVALASDESGDRFSSIDFNSEDLVGSDNGWSVAKYGTADQDNNNVVVFRLAEMYLIRAEARAHLGNVTGPNSAQSDINILRERANAPLIGTQSQAQMYVTIENERRYELAFEGHRWYDLVRTGRADVVMPGFSLNWKTTYNVLPIPQREIQNNPSLVGQQNPGY